MVVSVVSVVERGARGGWVWVAGVAGMRCVDDTQRMAPQTITTVARLELSFEDQQALLERLALGATNPEFVRMADVIPHDLVHESDVFGPKCAVVCSRAWERTTREWSVLQHELLKSPVRQHAKVHEFTNPNQDYEFSEQVLVCEHGWCIPGFVQEDGLIELDGVADEVADVVRGVHELETGDRWETLVVHNRFI